MGEYKFPCECSFADFGEGPAGYSQRLMDFKVQNIGQYYNCPLTWDLLSRGLTKGVFQLESGLGKKWAKRLKPDSIKELSALTAIIRPGTANSLESDGISLTEHYCRRKNKEEPVIAYHPSLDKILEDTYQICVYQESILRIARELASFTLEEADYLRKGVGHKVEDIILDCQQKFLKGCGIAKIVNEEQAKEIFGWIRKASRYSFNKCFSLDEKIIVNGKPTLISDLLKSPKKDYYSVSLRGFTPVENRIKGIYYRGKQQVFCIKTETGRKIRVTANHKFPTTDGNLSLNSMYHPISQYQFYCNQDGIIVPEKLSRIDYIYEEQHTADIEMEAPYHTLLSGSGIFSCNSHAVSYGVTSFDTAYIKAHFPIAFFTSYLRGAAEKPKPQKEIAELVVDAKNFDINVLPPDLRDLRPEFYFNNNIIKYGLTDIKRVGNTHFAKAKALLAEINIREANWYTLLCKGMVHLGSAAAQFINAGALDYLGIPRQRLLFELSIMEKFSEKELLWVGQNSHNFNNIKDLLAAASKTKKEGGAAHDIRRQKVIESQIRLLEQPPFSLVDSPDYIIATERELLGIPITVTPTSQYGVLPDIIQIKDFVNGLGGEAIGFCASVDEYKVFKIKNGNLAGQSMARMIISDDTGKLDMPIFPKTYENYKHLIDNEVVLCFYGSRDRKNLTQFIPNHITEMEFPDESGIDYCQFSS